MAAFDVRAARARIPVDIAGIFGVAAPQQRCFLAMTMGSWFQQMLQKSRRPTHARERFSGAAAIIGNLMHVLAGAG